MSSNALQVVRLAHEEIDVLDSKALRRALITPATPFVVLHNAGAAYGDMGSALREGLQGSVCVLNGDLKADLPGHITHVVSYIEHNVMRDAATRLRTQLTDALLLAVRQRAHALESVSRSSQVVFLLDGSPSCFRDMHVAYMKQDQTPTNLAFGARHMQIDRGNRAFQTIVCAVSCIDIRSCIHQRTHVLD